MWSWSALRDICRENAELATGEAEKLLGVRPRIFTDLEEMTRRLLDLDAVDVVCHALDLGLHMLVEKPMAITVGACRKIKL